MTIERHEIDPLPPTEFIAWFAGLLDGLDGEHPDCRQWTRIILGVRQLEEYLVRQKEDAENLKLPIPTLPTGCAESAGWLDAKSNVVSADKYASPSSQPKHKRG